VLLVERLRAAIAKLNPTINTDTRDDALDQLRHFYEGDLTITMVSTLQ